MRHLALLLILIGLVFSLGCESTEEILAVQDRVDEITAGDEGASTDTTPDTSTPAPDTNNDAGSSDSGNSDAANDSSSDSGSSGDGWSGSQRTFSLNGSSSGSVTFETRGITSQSGRNDNGGWEYIFLTLRGNGFDRVILYQVGGGRDAIRYLIGGPEPFTQNNATRDNLPGVHRWSVSWSGGTITIRLDGRTLGSHPFSGRPTKAIIGGYDSRGRDFRGEWRNASIQ